MFPFILVVISQVLGQPAVKPRDVSGPPDGIRINLAIGQLFVPDGYRPADGRVHLLLHLHGSLQAAEQNLARSGGDAVLVTVTLKGLSSVYREQFA